MHTLSCMNLNCDLCQSDKFFNLYIEASSYFALCCPTMNGYNNPNLARMGNFGANKNYMAAHSSSVNEVNVNDLLPEDPYKPKQQSRWVKESEKNHQHKQQQIAAEQSLFVPDSFKKSGSMNVHIQKVVHDESNKHINNNNYNHLAMPPKQSNPKQRQKNEHKQQQQIQNKNNVYKNNHRNNLHNNAKTANVKNVNQDHGQKRVMDQPISQPYFPKKPHDPFSKYLQKQPLNNQKQKQNEAKPYSNIQNNANNNNIRKQIVPQGQLHISNNNHQQRFECTHCGDVIGEEWTEDSKQRKYHNHCFICCECGISLGSVGKYVKCAKGMTCRSCRDKQIAKLIQ